MGVIVDNPITEDNIKELIEERRNVYSNVDEAVAAFNRENELSKEYNGRQVLELIQNADDANATEISIEIDRKNHNLKVQNNGEDFTYEGIKSIMIANLSSKITSYYIGNKGLGFRSLLAWSDDVRILSAGFCFHFSRDHARAVAKEKMDIAKVCEERKLSAGCCPFPMLGIPEFSGLDDKNLGSCTIVIHYKDKYEGEILEQIQSIDESSLFFLRKVGKICIKDGENERIVHISKKNDVIETSDNVWEIKGCSGTLPNQFQDPNKSERKKYNIQIAVPKETQNSSYPLYNFLPTSETIHLPFILHATLELSSSRNNINLCEENKFILGKAAELISNYVDTVLNNSPESSWYPYSLMTPQGNSSNIIETSLYDTIKSLRDEKNILPTIQGKYVGINDYYFNDNEDSEFWLDFKHGDILPHILRPKPENVLIEIKRIPDDVLAGSLNDADLTISERAGLIDHIIRKQMVNTKDLLTLLIDENEEKVKDGYTLFTPRGESISYQIPDFVRIQFLHPELFRLLTENLMRENFHKRFMGDDKPSTSRWLSKALRDCYIGQISDYDIDQVLWVIISQTNQLLLESSVELCHVYLKEMVKSISSIYFRKDGTSGEGFQKILEKIKLIDSEGTTCDASKLLFDNPLNRRIFGDNVHYLACADFWDITDDPHLFTEFFRKLGVNAIIEINKVEDFWNYCLWLKKGKLVPDDLQHSPQHLFDHMKERTFPQISKQFKDAIRKMSFGDVICLLSDDSIYSMIGARQRLIFMERPYCECETEYTYLRYQFLNLPRVKNKVLPGEAVLEELDEFVKELPSEKQTSLLSYLTTNIRGSEIQNVVDVLNEMSDKNIHQRVARKVYKAIIDAGVVLDGKNFKLLTINKEGETSYLPNTDVYYTDNAVPQKIIESTGKSRLCYASRAGEDKVCRTFGLQKLSNIEPDDVQKAEHPLSQEFKRRIDSIKPYVLLYCLQNVNKAEEKKALAGHLRNSSIDIVEHCSYKIQGESLDLGKDEFISKDSVYYANASGKYSIQELCDSVEFCTSIAEILSIICKVNGRNDSFMNLFQNISFMKQKIRSEFSEDEIKEAKELMGMSREELDFYHLLLGNEFSEDVDIQDIQSKICAVLEIESFPFEKVDFRRWIETPQSYELLEIVSKVKPDVIQSLDLSSLHKVKMNDIKREEKDKFIHTLWKKLSEAPSRQKEYFDTIDDYDNVSIVGYEHGFFSREGYISLLQKVVSEKWGLILSEDIGHHGCLYPQCEEIFNELSSEEKSLLCFEGHEEEANSYKCRTDGVRIEEEKNLEDKAVQVTPIFVDYSKLSARPAPSFNKSHGHGKGKVHSKSQDAKMEKAGKRAELLVKHALENLGYSFKWRSGYSDHVEYRDDTLGYDFEYREVNANEDRFLEVKNFSSGGFLISANEMNTAKSPDKAGRYDIALVDNGRVFIIKNFFNGNNFTKVDNEYAIYLDINQE